MSEEQSQWTFVGLVSSFPDISHDNEKCHVLPGCKTLSIPRQDVGNTRMNRLSNLNDQVLVFKYKGFIHAIDNQCPHSSFPLKEGNVFDIEDLGTAGIRCFRHGWRFDLFTGKGDGGPHTLNLWDIELRDSSSLEVGTPGKIEKEVWVKRPPRN
ncbi:uncharacterized protein N7483_009162 [Penicillium malachiteum]|uniref:uncharacterized protein n=1 Tax=Penicillium malachiteum TaxID=1324776 RepID=UPI0025498B24|nr:uncharacterized protein N7483_009162 [Penicillium malachiteum]KAJ5721228.1 hypothetical protein N7483_009162 [Penicillium malachiteum]